MTDPRVAPQAARFGDVADRYERARPLYPESALSELAARCGVRPGTAVLDLGAGTGKLTRQLVAVGADVVAVEPAAGMRRRLEAEVTGVPVLDGTAEAIPTARRLSAGRHGGTGVPLVRHAPGPGRDRPRAPAGRLAGTALERAARVGVGGRALGPATAADRRQLSTIPGRGWAEVLDADDRFGPRTSNRHDVVVTTTVDEELEDSESRSCVHVVDEGRRRDVLDRLRAFLEAHPETAGRWRLTYTRPCTLHLCQRVR